SIFFFQAEDGIRDFHVTGVQTCALPISPATGRGNTEAAFTLRAAARRAARAGWLNQVRTRLSQSLCKCTLAITLLCFTIFAPIRSEERRVGKECRSRDERDHEKKQML